MTVKVRWRGATSYEHLDTKAGVAFHAISQVGVRAEPGVTETTCRIIPGMPVSHVKVGLLYHRH